MSKLRDLMDIPPHWPRNALATTIVTLFCFMVIWVFTNTYPEANSRIVYFLGGQVTGFVSLILSFYFGDTEKKVIARKETEQ